MSAPPVHKVYILRRVVDEVIDLCERRAPVEALGVLVGYRCRHEGQRYIRVVDWATGQVDASGAHARFKPEGVREYHIELDERYGNDRKALAVVGVFHSHPFGGQPRLSERDLETFCQFPYDAEGNAFVLVNPRTRHFVVFQRDDAGDLVEQEWVEYAPHASPSD